MKAAARIHQFKRKAPVRDYLTVDLKEHQDLKMALQEAAAKRGYKVAPFIRQMLKRLLLDGEIEKISISG